MDSPGDTWTEVAQVPEGLLLEMWQLWLMKRHGLTPVDVWGRHGHPRTGLSKARKRELWRDEDWRSWAEKIASMHVVLKPDGRATSREREEDAVLTVHFQWNLDHGTPMVVSALIVPDWQLAFNEAIDLDAHMLACRVQLAKDPPKRARLPNRPRPGEARDVAFYRQLLAEYEGLLREARPAPARELANRRGINYSTLKSYLKRGREYLQKEED